MGINKWKNVVQTEKDLKGISSKIGISFTFKLSGMAESIVKLEIVLVCLQNL